VGFTDCSIADKARLAKQSLHASLSAVADCVGVDLDGESIRQLQERGVFHDVLQGNVESLEQLPSSLGRFDVALAGDVVEHLSSPGRMLDGVRGLLEPEGTLMISTPNAMGLPSYVRFLFGLFHEGPQRVLNFNPISLAQLLTRHPCRRPKPHPNHFAGAFGLDPVSPRKVTICLCLSVPKLNL
jgi:SAM-dependent methyltransferase